MRKMFNLSLCNRILRDALVYPREHLLFFPGLVFFFLNGHGIQPKCVPLSIRIIT